MIESEKSIQILSIKHESSKEYPVYNGMHPTSPSFQASPES